MDRRKRRWIICLVISMCVSAFSGLYKSKSRRIYWDRYYEQIGAESTKEADTYVAQQGEPAMIVDQDSEESDTEEQDIETDMVWEQPEKVVLSSDGRGELISDADAAAGP